MAAESQGGEPERRPNRLPTIVVGVVLGLIAANCRAANAGGEFAISDPTATSPLEAELFRQVDAGRLDRCKLIDAALVASGVDRAEALERYRRKYAEWRDSAAAVVRADGSPLRQAAAIFAFMHRKILRGGYSAGATELTRLFDTGQFNCASATVLYTALAADCGLNVRGIELPRHAFCELRTADCRLSIETTCPNWFRIAAADADTTDPKQAATDRAAVAELADARARGRAVSPLALIGVIYYNRGIDFLNRGQFAAAVSANLRALRFDPANAAARGNLLAAINNWALARSAAGEYQSAAELLDEGRRIDPDHEPFLNNQRHVYRLWIESLAAAGSRAEAAEVLSAARQAQPASILWSLCAKRFGL